MAPINRTQCELRVQRQRRLLGVSLRRSLSEIFDSLPCDAHDYQQALENLPLLEQDIFYNDRGIVRLEELPLPTKSQLKYRKLTTNALQVKDTSSVGTNEE